MQTKILERQRIKNCLLKCILDRNCISSLDVSFECEWRVENIFYLCAFCALLARIRRFVRLEHFIDLSHFYEFIGLQLPRSTMFSARNIFISWINLWKKSLEKWLKDFGTAAHIVWMLSEASVLRMRNSMSREFPTIAFDFDLQTTQHFHSVEIYFPLFPKRAKPK